MVPQQPKNYIYSSGMYTFLGLIILLLGLTFVGGVNYGQILNDLLTLVTGGVSRLPDGSGESLWRVMLNCTAICLLLVVTSYTIGMTAIKITGKPKSYASSSLDAILDRGPLVFFLVIVGEELLGRWIFLGLLTKVFPGDFAFYTLMILGNAIWAVIHLKNYEDPNERSLLFILPQFVGGIAFTYLFVKYGLFVTIMAHYIYDVILLSSRKEEPFNGLDWRLLAYYTICTIVSGFVLTSMGLSVEVLSQWFVNVERISPLANVSFWGYVWLIVFIDSVLEVLARVLLFDIGSSSTDMSTVANPLFHIFFYAAILAMLLALNWVAGFFVQDPVTRTFLTVLLMTFLASTTSGSMLAKTWFISAPVYFVMTATLLALGFWSVLSLMIVVGAINYYPTLLKFSRRKDEALQEFMA